MAHKVVMNGTTYAVKGGRTLIGGTGYAVKGGRTLVGGTTYGVTFITEYTIRVVLDGGREGDASAQISVNGISMGSIYVDFDHRTTEKILRVAPESIVTVESDAYLESYSIYSFGNVSSGTHTFTGIVMANGSINFNVVWS